MVSVEKAVKMAKKLSLRWQDELTLYLVHGILHLIGYSDKTKDLSRDEAVKRIDSQMPLAEKVSRASIVIDNDSLRDLTRQQVETIYKTLAS